MAGEDDADWHWADEELRQRGGDLRGRPRLRELTKYALAFADEALILLLLLYLLYRLFG